MLKMKKSIIKALYATLLCFCAFMMMLFATADYSDKMLASVGAVKERLTGKEVLVIDAGHGGMDGGAVSSNGTCEKDINLAIALEIKELAEADGWKVVATREDDKLLKTKSQGKTSEEKKSIRMTKTEDLMARKEIIDKENPLLAVSIHLNSFKENTKVRGAQVFYTNSGSVDDKSDKIILENSRILGETIQKSLVDGLKDGTNRIAMGKKDARILKNPKVPTVIVECGFLSNSVEAKLLTSEDYQSKLAKLIYKGIMDYSNKMPVVKIPIITT